MKPSHYYLGIDLGGTNIAAAVVDEEGVIYGRSTRKTNAPRPYEEIFNDMAECAFDAARETGIDFNEIVSVGIGCPGAVDKESGRLEFANNLDFYDVPESLGLQTKDVPEYDEDKVRDEIVKDLNNKKDDNINKITTNYDSEVGLLKDKKETLTDEKIENQKIINEIYDNESLKLESQAIKRGLARSSIILGQLANVENNRAIELSDNLNALNSGIAEIESEMADLIKNRDRALENLDIEYAEELENKLQESKNEYKKAVDEVIEFNNQVKKLESEYKMDYENNKLKWKEGVLDLTQYGYDEFRKRIQNAKYDYMISYLSQFPKSEAISILVSNTNFKDLLGGDYSKVYEYLLSR